MIAGNGPLNLQLACELLDGGVAVAAVVEAAPRPGLAQWRQAAALLRAGADLAWDGLGYLRKLRAAGVPVLWGSTPLACEGEGRFATLVLATPAGEARIAADACALNLGFQPETGLARALGAAHRFVDVGLGQLETVTDADGRTSCPDVFAIGDGAALGGARVALARGRLAGLAAARDLGLAAPDDPAARAALRAGAGFQEALWRLFAAPPFDIAAIADGTIVCRCEEVTAGSLRAAQAEGAGLARRAEEGDAGRHGPLPGALLRRRRSPGSAGATGRGRLRRAARAGEAGARRGADAGAAGGGGGRPGFPGARHNARAAAPAAAPPATPATCW